MNPITKALDEIRFEIPPQILKAVFVNQDMDACGAVISMEHRIREMVLEPRVFVDIDLMGGTEAFLPLDNPVRAEYHDPYTVIYYIPDEVVQNRPIVQVYSVHFALLGYQNAGMALHYTESPLGAATRQVLDSAMRVPPAQTSYLNIIAHNVVMCRFVYLPYKTAFMRVRLGSDNALSHIRAPAIPSFAELCVLATKAYIYNQMNILVDEAYLSGGRQLGTFRSVIDGYADANEMYKERLKRWSKISVLNDPEASRRHLRSLIGSP